MRIRQPTTWAPPTQQIGPRNDWQTIKTFLPYLWPQGERELQARVVLAFLFLAAAKAVTVAVPILFKDAIDALSGPSDLLVVPVAMIVLYGVGRMAGQAFGEFRELVFVKVAQRAIRTIGLQIFRHLHGLALRFHLDRQTGGLSRAIERGTKGIEFLLNFLLFSILPTIIEVMLVSIVLWRLYDWRYAAVTMSTIALYIVFTLLITEWRTKYRRTMNEVDSEANTKAVDSLLNYETVKYFGNEDHEARRFDNALQRYERAAIKSKTTLSILNLGQGAIIALGLIVVMLMAGAGVRDHVMTVGDFVLVNAYLIQLYLPLNFLGFVYREVKQALTDMEAMFRLLRENQEVQDRTGAPALALNGGAVEFDDVHFGYGADRGILKGISFRVPPGRSVAIVGPSGAGKSTISRLLFRFYDVNQGAVRIDGQDIREITQASLRGAIGIVPQDTVLFNDTIYYNIAYGRPAATREEVEHAAKLARIHDFVTSLPQGYETRVGERGLKLSGGEKQRVAIARTILKGPAILLFDEATSALDTHTEKEIQVSLREVAANRTTLIIAHRLSTVVDADEILVLVDGTIVERGRHFDLLAHGGRYAEMWQKQQEAAQAKALLDDAVLQGAAQ